MGLMTVSESVSETRDIYEGFYKTPPKVLIVDDDEDQRSSLSELLLSTGLRPIAVGTGEEALELFQETQFDLSIVDGRLPDIPGHQLIGELKILEPSCPCILLTGFPEAYAADLAVNSGADGFVVKPANPEFLCSLIEGALFHRILLLERERFQGVMQTLRTFRHEICNPLQGLLGSIELLTRRVNHDPDVTRYAANIQVSAERIMSLLDRLDRLKHMDTRDTPVGPMLQLPTDHPKS